MITKELLDDLAEAATIVEDMSNVCKTETPDFYICGGYIRDRILGVKPSDLDVVVFNKQDWDVEWRSSEEDDEYADSLQVCVADTGVFHKGSEIQLIWREGQNTLQDVFEYHFLKLSNVAYSGLGFITIDPGFISSIVDKAFYVSNDGTGLWKMYGADKYMDKTKLKYHDYIIPTETQDVLDGDFPLIGDLEVLNG